MPFDNIRKSFERELEDIGVEMSDREKTELEKLRRTFITALDIEIKTLNETVYVFLSEFISLGKARDPRSLALAKTKLDEFELWIKEAIQK